MILQSLHSVWVMQRAGFSQSNAFGCSLHQEQDPTEEIPQMFYITAPVFGLGFFFHSHLNTIGKSN